MSKSNRMEFDRLLARALDQRLEPAEIARLEQVLVEDVSAREEYVQLTILQSFIEQECQALSLESEIRESLGEAIGEPSVAECDGERERSRAAGRVFGRIARSLGIATVDLKTPSR